MNEKNTQIKQIYLFSFLSSAVIVLFTFESYVGIGITLCTLINSVLLFAFLRNKQETTNKKAFLWLVPLNLLALSYTINANRMLNALNYIIAALLICATLLSLQNSLQFFSGGFGFLGRSIAHIFKPLAFIGKFFANLAVLFGKKTGSKKMGTIFMGIAICIPVIFVVLTLLSSADVVFRHYLNNISFNIDNEFARELIEKIVFTIIFAIYIFGLLFMHFYKKELRQTEALKQPVYSAPSAKIDVAPDAEIDAMQAQGEQNVQSKQSRQSGHNEVSVPSGQNDQSGQIVPPVYSANVVYGANAVPKKEPDDLIIVTMLNASLLVIYSFFAYVQITYLFMGTALPEGFTYAEYARQGFFELLILTFINVVVLLLTINFAKKRIYESEIKGSFALKIVMAIVCALTMFLLYSSFYKMVLYHNEYGLTRLRLLVMIFLAFEALGLLATFAFIFKPNIKIIACYTVICLVFYVSVNLINIDGIIAKNHIDNYLRTGDRLDYRYLSTLSADAHDELMRLNDIEYEYELYTDAYGMFYKIGFDEYEIELEFIGENYEEWQSFNIAYNYALNEE